MRLLLGAAVVAALVTSMGGCSGEGAASSTDAGITKPRDAGDPNANDWSCLGAVHFPSPTEASLQIPVLLTDAVAYVPIVGSQIRACSDPSDPSCAAPVDMPRGTDAQGMAPFVLPPGTSGFSGYFEVSQPGQLTNLHAVWPPFWESVSSYWLAEWADSDFKAYTDGVGVAWDTAAHGSIIIEAHDCAGLNAPYHGVMKLAEGLTFNVDTADAKTAVGYMKGLLVTANGPTNAGGAAAIINVPPGVATVTGTLTATGQT
ncbi:MAG: hypothetical protein ABIP89_16975, partial [Polyangiaceae bacterium]